MNPHLALYLAETRQTELRTTAAKARAAATASNPGWTDRLRAVAVRRRPLVAQTLAAPAARRTSTLV
jgi:hypothetical protein